MSEWYDDPVFKTALAVFLQNVPAIIDLILTLEGFKPGLTATMIQAGVSHVAGKNE